MPLRDAIVLALISAVFVLFGVVLAWVSWYSQRGAKTPRPQPGLSGDGYASSSGLIVDDD
ncbi:MAG TPA: hypothetical protein VG651_10405 [Stellaceae bacterium]|nr:hypothetical protein [Stellaceae bacterium]